MPIKQGAYPAEFRQQIVELARAGRSHSDLAALRRELGQVKQERDILAKATAWFAHKSEADTPSIR